MYRSIDRSGSRSIRSIDDATRVWVSTRAHEKKKSPKAKSIDRGEGVNLKNVD